MKIIKKGASATLVLVAMAMNAHASPCENSYGEVSSQINQAAPLTLNGVISEIRNVSPEVRASALEARALAAEAEQAGRRLNPALTVEIENFAGGGVFSSFNQSETTIALEQTFRLGGKRNLAHRAARARQALATAKCDLVLREAELEAALLYAELTAAVRIHILASDAATLSDTLTETVDKRVNAGAAAPPELARARADSATLKAAAIEAEAEIERRRYALAALWGSADPQFLSPQMSSQTFSSKPSEANISTHPRITAAEAAIRARAADYEAAKAQSIPDITVAAGLRRFEGTGDNAFVAGFSLPLPLFDRNRGNIRAADIRASASSANRAAIEARLLADQRAAISSVRAAENRLAVLTDEALPAAEEAYAAAIRGYAVGKFDLTTTLDARAALINTRVAVIQASLSRQTYDLRLRSLIGAAPFEGDK
jgi:cobalt-zinc-cadmium efflux system outer membrane protein